MLEEAFATGVIVRITFLREGLNKAVRIKFFAECKTCVFGALVAVKKDMIRTPSIYICFFEDTFCKINVVPACQIPAYDFTGKEVNNNTKVTEVTVEFM